VPPLESQIDDLYKGPLGEFVARRAALARTLKADDARRVKGLQKPTVVPWAVNQLYWHARPVYDRLVSGGERLRAAQIDALKGRATDVRRATDAHRKAMAMAVAEASRHLSGGGAHPSADDLAKTLEAVSLARELPERPGRLTKALRPAGFEALAGIPVKPTPRAVAAPRPARQAQDPRSHIRLLDRPRPGDDGRPDPALKSAARKRDARDARRKKAIERAAAVATRAKAAEARARTAWERAKQALAAAELTLATLEDRRV
jgi:hypothetical protein